MKTILVPTDFSKGAEKALYYAIEFAKKENAKLLILNAYSVNYPVAETPLYVVDEIKTAARAEAETKLKSLEAIIQHAGNISAEFHAEEGAPAQVVPGFAKDENVDLIVMGTQGVNSIANRVFGSTAAKVIEKAACPVITVPENCSFHTIKKITYATNYDKQDIRNLKLVTEFAGQLGAQVNILHLADEGMSPYYDKTTMERFMDKINKEIPYSDLTFQVLSSTDATDSFYKYINSNAADLLVLAPQHHTFFERLTGQSLTKKLAIHINIPLMAFHSSSQKNTESESLLRAL